MKWHAVLSEMGFQHQIYDEDGTGIAGVYNYVGEEAGKQNALLMAASPVMRDALRDVRDFLQRSGYDTRLVQAALNLAETGTDNPLKAYHVRLQQERECSNDS